MLLWVKIEENVDVCGPWLWTVYDLEREVLI